MNNLGSDAEGDLLLPWLLRLRETLETKPVDFNMIVSDCVARFKHDMRYRDDSRFLRVWLLHLEASNDDNEALRELEECECCSEHSILFELFAVWLEAKEELEKAHHVYKLGISRKARPVDRLKNAFTLFLCRINNLTSRLQKHDSIAMGQVGSNDKPSLACTTKVLSERLNSQHENLEIDKEKEVGVTVNPWSKCTAEQLSMRIKAQLVKCEGYHHSNKAYRGESLSSLRNISRNKTIKLGSKIYHVKGCAGKGAFAQVFKAYDDTSPDDIVALKIQTPAFPWEFYMYRQLDYCILGQKRSCFGYAHSMHVYSDYSILVCDYYASGTLQDVINSYVVVGKFMEEVLCIFYTVEMLYMLETLHAAGIIHGDFKPDNLLVRHSRKELVEDEYRDRQGAWNELGLCLVDWGRGIDLKLFPLEVAFDGDCRTSGFRCVEMQEKRPWKYQVDTYGLCVGVHLMLHNSYMKVMKKPTADGGYCYQPTTSFKRYWNVELWSNLFTQLLNNQSLDNDVEMLQNLRQGFQDYLTSNHRLLNQLKHLLAKRRQALCSA